ncbi:MAG TPA: hypothetical protein VFF03_05140 [Rhodocyclaceae bacterium]|nr:hypothetical protein [Rhodocyclaceae bacterium]
MKHAALLVLLFHAGTGLAEEAPVIGRLFAPASLPAASGDTAQPPAGQRIRVDGAVIRSSGKNTIWLNGEPLTENSPGAIVARTDRASLPAVRITDTRTGATARTRVGEESELGGSELSPPRSTAPGGRAK